MVSSSVHEDGAGGKNWGPWVAVEFVPLLEWSQRDLERAESVKFCRQYLVFHDSRNIVYSGPSGACTEIKGE